jgi:hypothetical protein
MMFKDLAIGTGFDFVSPEPHLNSFYLHCIKISPRRYRDERGMVHRIGTVKAAIYNVR